MAKEITTNTSVSIASKGSSKASGAIATSEDIAGAFVGFQVTAGTTAAQIELGALTAPKLIYIQNNDAANFVEVDNVISMDGWPQKILPGTGILIRPQSTDLFAQADQAPVAIWVVAG